ncbi:MAG TPA: hypothetical protein VGD37_18825 [Kofleriaceae bacterium]
MNAIETLPDNSDVELPVDPPGFPEGLNGVLQVTPEHIAAGDTVYVDWSAHAPFSGFRFQINGTDVPLRGRHEYRPLDNASFALTATRGRSTYSLAHQAVSVDRSACTIQGKTATEAALRSILGASFYAELNPAANVRFPVGLFTIGAWLDAPGNVEVTLEADTGLMRVVVPLQLTLAGKDRNGMMTVTAWISPMLGNGVIYPTIVRMTTEITIPPPVWFALVLLGIEVVIGIALTNTVAPSVFTSAIMPPTGGIAALFALFGDRVASVNINTSDPSGPFLDTIVCP